MKNHIFCELKEVTEGGTFKGIASVYGVEDLGGDVIDKGAFTKTISENPRVPILWQHDAHEVIGFGEVKEWQGKVLITGSLDMEDPTAAKAHRKMKGGLVRGLSIGFSTIKSTWETVGEKMVRHIGELKLWEVSVVTFPMLPAAHVTSVKAEDLEAQLERTNEQIKALLAENATAKAAGEAAAAAKQEQTEPVDHSAAVLAFMRTRAMLRQ